ncbi:protein NO VEIN domain-containing protein [Chryseobacterium kwangjuense]|uniref:Protein NO VEIN domain-containing protein n=1 Tax=Chryseobacterium kwangjuense TaxID=267125 RepID=A0ABW9JXQ3_9FLAO
MKTNNILGLYTALYLAKFNEEAYLNLGFGNQIETHKRIGAILNVKPATIKNWRDEFDPLFGHRAGWYQRGLSISRIRVLDAIGDLNEPSLRSIVQDILNNNQAIGLTEELEQLISIIPEEKKKKQKRSYIPRNITGRKAEEIFREWFKSDQKNIPQGKDFVDMRDYGCGYDFQIVVSDKKVYAIEVKGLSEGEGGILITGKEWETASIMKMDYYLVLVSNIDKNPVITVINNPYEKLSPKRNLQTVIQVNWTVSSDEICQLKNNLS